MKMTLSSAVWRQNNKFSFPKNNEVEKRNVFSIYFEYDATEYETFSFIHSFLLLLLLCVELSFFCLFS